MTAELQAAVEIANVPSLICVLVQLTGDRKWLDAPYRPRAPRGMDDNDSGGLPPAIQAEVRAAALEALLAQRAGKPVAIPDPDPELLVAMLSAAMGEDVPAEYGPMIAADLRASPQVVEAPEVAAKGTAIIIGAGVSGICAAVNLTAAGIPYTIVERNSSFGGVWLENRYPGAGVDTPSHLYEFSFAPHDWPHYFATRDEVHGYLHEVAERHGIEPNVRFGTTVTAATFATATRQWLVDVTDADGNPSTLTCDVLISGVGAFNPPKVPHINGIDSFPGPAFHTAQWQDADLNGKRVAVIGNGASAMQCVPAIVDQVESLTVFQRSNHWVAPFAKFHLPVPEPLRALMAESHLYRSWYRIRLGWTFNDKLHSTLQRDADWPYPERAINAVNDRHREYYTAYINEELADRPDLIEAVTPTYPPYGKRILMDNGWYRALAKPNVTLVTAPISHVSGTAIVTTADTQHDVDVVIYATGFDVVRFLSTFELRGRSGATLRETWGEDDAKAFLGLAVPDFPNFFILYGPNTQPGHGGSLIAAVEAQMHFVMSVLAKALDCGVDTLEVRDDSYQAYNARVDAAHEQMVWTHPGMDTYYRNSAGRVVVNNPFRIIDFWEMTRALDPADFDVEHAVPDEPVDA